MPNNLPNPIPAGSVVFVPDANGKYWSRSDGSMNQRYLDSPHPGYTRHTLTAPLHHLTLEMVEAVQRYFYERDNGAVMHHHISALRAAFALLLERKAEESKEKTVRERLKDYCAYPSATDLLFAASLDSILARLDKAGI